MWYLCEKAKCQAENKKQVKHNTTFTIPGALLAGQVEQPQAGHKCSFSPCCGVGVAPWQTLQSSFLGENLMDRRNLKVPFMSTFVSEGNNNFFQLLTLPICQRAKIWPSLSSGYAALWHLLSSFSYYFHLGLCVYLYIRLCSLTKTKTRDRKPFSPPAIGETCYASSIQSNPLVIEVHLQPN